MDIVYPLNVTEISQVGRESEGATANMVSHRKALYSRNVDASNPHTYTCCSSDKPTILLVIFLVSSDSVSGELSSVLSDLSFA